MSYVRTTDILQGV